MHFTNFSNKDLAKKRLKLQTGEMKMEIMGEKSPIPNMVMIEISFGRTHPHNCLEMPTQITLSSGK